MSASGMLEFEFRGLDRVIHMVEVMPKTINTWMLARMFVSAGIMEAAVVSRTPVGATGHAKQSWTSQVRGRGVNIQGRVFSRDKPAKMMTLEHGRTPGRPMPPPSALMTWVIRKGIAGGQNPRAVAFVIARSIGIKGFEGFHMVQESKDAEFPRLEQLWDSWADQLIRAIVSG